MGIHFVCKTKEQPIFRNDLIPGRATSGVDGSTGSEGTNGPSIHFSDYSPTNDYIKGMMKEKIKNNLVLSSGNTTSLQKIKYVDGDIILARDLLVYRLEIDGENIDFRYLGKLTDKQKESELVSDENLINNIGEIEFTDFTGDDFDIAIPSNRCIDSSSGGIRLKGFNYNIPQMYYIDYPDSSTSTTYKDTFKKTFGYSFKPVIHVTNQSLKNDWNFYLRIYMKIKKSPQYNSYIIGDNGYEYLMDPCHKDMQGSFQFYKYAEIKLNAEYNSNYQTDIDSSSSIYNITDMSCDKLHPAGNNINSNYIHSHNYIELKVLVDIFHSQKFRFRIGGIDSSRLNWDNTGIISGPGSKRTGESLNSDPSAKESEFSEWSMQQFQTLPYNNLRGYLQYSLYSNHNPNFRSGDSAYFSGMYQNEYLPLCFNPNQQIYNIRRHIDETTVNDTNSYDNFIKHERILNENTRLLHDDSDNSSYCGARIDLERRHVCDKVKNFLLNPENIYELVCVNKKTGVTKIMNTRVKTT